jgi:ABC-type polysaccharide/polyol phosphate export permease
MMHAQGSIKRIMKTYINELIKRKDLVLYLVTSGLKAQHRNSFLGYFWWMLDPLLGTLVYYFLVVVALGRGGEGYGPFLVVGLVVFKSISASMTTSAKSISGQGGIISQVYLPKAIFPISSSLTQLVNFFFGLMVIGLFLIFFRIMPSARLLWLPLILVSQQLFIMALSLILGYLCVFIRDIENLLTHLVRILRYASPVLWAGGSLPEKYSWVVRLNPLSAYLNSYRNIFLYDADPEFRKLLLIGVLSLIINFLMILYYSRHEHKIIKVL